MTRTLDELYTLVTDAVLLAEQTEHPDDYEALSKLEEEIASITSGDDIEGQIARVGSIASAWRALDKTRFLSLIERYSPELPPNIREQLNEMAINFQENSGDY